ncbi:MAG: ABC transporter ATP-binding protein [Pseudodonghicola sp.]
MKDMDTTASILTVEDLTVAYGSKIAVDRASLRIAPGECVALVGATGAGKSSLLKTMVGIQKPRAGTIHLHGLDVTGWQPSQSVRHGVILCPEGRHLFPEMSVHDNLLLGNAARDDSAREVKALLAGIEELFPVLRDRRHQTAGTLSGGEQQMVAIGRALMGRPELLILDEPSLGLAPLLVARMFDIVTTIAERGCAVLISEQNVRSALEVAHRAYVMEAGRIVMSGAAEELTSDPTLLAAFLGVGE